MKICEYELIINKVNKHTSLQIKEEYSYGQECFTQPNVVVGLMNQLFHLDQMADEYVYLLAFNHKMRLLGLFEVSHGIGNASLIDARGVFMRALQIGAANIILAHNHPSGFPIPSREDFDVCRRMKDAGVLIGIELLDFIVIGSNDFTSFREKELL